MEKTTDNTVVLLVEHNSVSIKSVPNKLDPLSSIDSVLIKIRNNQTHADGLCTLSETEKETVRLMCSFAATTMTGTCHAITGHFSSANLSLNALLTSINIPDEQASETNETEFEKIKQRTKLSTKGKSSYGPQRR